MRNTLDNAIRKKYLFSYIVTVGSHTPVPAAGILCEGSFNQYLPDTIDISFANKDDFTRFITEMKDKGEVIFPRIEKKVDWWVGLLEPDPLESMTEMWVWRGLCLIGCLVSVVFFPIDLGRSVFVAGKKLFLNGRI